MLQDIHNHFGASVNRVKLRRADGYDEHDQMGIFNLQTRRLNGGTDNDFWLEPLPEAAQQQLLTGFCMGI